MVLRRSGRLAVAGAVLVCAGAVIAWRRSRRGVDEPAPPSHIQLPDGMPADVRSAIAEGLGSGGESGAPSPSAPPAPAWIRIPGDASETPAAPDAGGDGPDSDPSDPPGAAPSPADSDVAVGGGRPA